MCEVFSSPLGEFIFYICLDLSGTQIKELPFSSPLGEFVFYIVEILCSTVGVMLFSSPLGIFVFYIWGNRSVCP